MRLVLRFGIGRKLVSGLLRSFSAWLQLRGGSGRFDVRSFVRRLFRVGVGWRGFADLLGSQERGDSLGGFFRRRIVIEFVFNRLSFFVARDLVWRFRFGGRASR